MTNAADNSSRLRWLIILLLSAVVVLCGAIVYLLLDTSADTTPGDTASTPRAVVEPLFVKVGPMTVNLQGEGYGRQLLYIGLSLKTEDKGTQAALLRYMPELQSRLLILLSGQDGEALVSPQGKERLAGDISALLDSPFVEGQAPLAVDAVLFTDFILQ
ncbi:MAG: flagellar basal body-associated protein FliL [Pseudomonas sp.]